MSRAGTRRVLVNRAAAAAAAWWSVSGKTCVAAYQPKGAASLALSYVNLANPGTYDAAPGLAPNWDAINGWVFASVNPYLTTGISPGSGWSAFIRFANAGTTGDTYLFGGFNGAGKEFWVSNHFVGTGVNYANGTRAGATLPTATSGVLGIAGTACYRDGVPETATTSGNATGARAIYINGMNIGSLYGGCVQNVQAFVIYSATLTAGEVATVSAAMAAL